MQPTKMTWEQSKGGEQERGIPLGRGFYHFPEPEGKQPFLDGQLVWKTDVQDAAGTLEVPFEG
jgi:hypothetical protein